MNIPKLVVVTGRPGSGKTTFANAFGDAACLPVIGRDKIKEGYVHTAGKSHAELPPQTNGVVNEICFGALMKLIEGGVSVIVEAAFQHNVWKRYLAPFEGKARLYLIICKADDRVAYERYIRRGLNNPRRIFFHGDPGVDAAGKGMEREITPYEEPRLDVPTIYVDTAGDYDPSIDEIEKIVFDT